MSEAAVAIRYAKPLLELAIEKGIADEVYQDMTLLKEACDVNQELKAVLKNPIIRGHKKFSILKELFASKVNPLTMSMYEIMTRKNRENVLYTFSKEFEKLYNIHKGIAKVTVTSSIKLRDDIRKELEDKLAQNLNKTIHLTEKVSPEMIGGFVVQIGNSQIDNSIKNSLQRLKTNFIQQLYN